MTEFVSDRDMDLSVSSSEILSEYIIVKTFVYFLDSEYYFANIIYPPDKCGISRS
jgi:hypothetical protein